MLYAFTLARGLKKYGRRLQTQQDGEVKTVWAILEQGRRKNRFHFEYKASEIGRYYQDYYFYYGPASFDIRTLGENAVLTAGDERFVFVHRDAVYFAGCLLCFRGVLKRLEDEDVFTE